MKCKTRDFGMIDVQEEAIIEFIQPLFGFEEYRNYFLLFDDSLDFNIAWMQSIEEPSLCFILMRDICFSPNYTPTIEQDVLTSLGKENLEVWTICVIPENPSEATVNLKSPILINPTTQRAMQIILEDEYPVRYPLAEKVV